MHQLNPAQIDHYRQNGYLVVDGLLTCTEVDAFVAYEAGLDDIGPRGLKNHRDDEQWAQLAHHSNITGVVRQLLASSPRIVQTFCTFSGSRRGDRGAGLRVGVGGLVGALLIWGVPLLLRG